MTRNTPPADGPEHPSLIELTQRAIELTDFAVLGPALRNRLLESTMELVPCKGPCSLFHMTGFYADGGEMDIRRTIHKQLPGGPLRRLILTLWTAHVRRRDSPIEKALHRESIGRPVGSGSVGELLNREEWLQTKEGKLATKFGIRDLAYMWFRCSESTLWAVALRRYESEPVFSKHDLSLLHNFAAILRGSLSLWYRERLDRLTAREQEVLIDLINYTDTAKPSAKRLGIAVRTYYVHTTAIRKKLGAKTKAEVIATLGRRPRPEQTE